MEGNFKSFWTCTIHIGESTYERTRYFGMTTTTTEGHTEFTLAAASHDYILRTHMNEHTRLDDVTETQNKKRTLKKSCSEEYHSSSHGQ